MFNIFLGLEECENAQTITFDPFNNFIICQFLAVVPLQSFVEIILSLFTTEKRAVEQLSVTGKSI